jgi:hypothetical protein
MELDIKGFPEFDTAETSDLFFATVKFYIDEKFIKCEKQYYGGFSEIVLTSKGFSVLNATPPEQFSSKSNIAIALKDAIATGKTEFIKTLVSEAIKVAVKMATIF